MDIGMTGPHLDVGNDPASTAAQASNTKITSVVNPSELHSRNITGARVGSLSGGKLVVCHPLDRPIGMDKEKKSQSEASSGSESSEDEQSFVFLKQAVGLTGCRMSRSRSASRSRSCSSEYLLERSMENLAESDFVSSVYASNNLTEGISPGASSESAPQDGAHMSLEGAVGMAHGTQHIMSWNSSTLDQYAVSPPEGFKDLELDVGHDPDMVDGALGSSSSAGTHSIHACPPDIDVSSVNSYIQFGYSQEDTLDESFLKIDPEDVDYDNEPHAVVESGPVHNIDHDEPEVVILRTQEDRVREKHIRHSRGIAIAKIPKTCVQYGDDKLVKGARFSVTNQEFEKVVQQAPEESIPINTDRFDVSGENAGELYIIHYPQEEDIAFDEYPKLSPALNLPNEPASAKVEQGMRLSWTEEASQVSDETANRVHKEIENLENHNYPNSEQSGAACPNYEATLYQEQEHGASGFEHDVAPTSGSHLSKIHDINDESMLVYENEMEPQGKYISQEYTDGAIFSQEVQSAAKPIDAGMGIANENKPETVEIEDAEYEQHELDMGLECSIPPGEPAEMNTTPSPGRDEPAPQMCIPPDLLYTPVLERRADPGESQAGQEPGPVEEEWPPSPQPVRLVPESLAQEVKTVTYPQLDYKSEEVGTSQDSIVSESDDNVDSVSAQFADSDGATGSQSEGVIIVKKRKWPDTCEWASEAGAAGAASPGEQITSADPTQEDIEAAVAEKRQRLSAEDYFADVSATSTEDWGSDQTDVTRSDSRSDSIPPGCILVPKSFRTETFEPTGDEHSEDETLVEELDYQNLDEKELLRKLAQGAELEFDTDVIKVKQRGSSCLEEATSCSELYAYSFREVLDQHFEKLRKQETDNLLTHEDHVKRAPVKCVDAAPVISCDTSDSDGRTVTPDDKVDSSDTTSIDNEFDQNIIKVRQLEKELETQARTIQEENIASQEATSELPEAYLLALHEDCDHIEDYTQVGTDLKTKSEQFVQTPGRPILPEAYICAFHDEYDRSRDTGTLTTETVELLTNAKNELSETVVKPENVSDGVVFNESESDVVKNKCSDSSLETEQENTGRMDQSHESIGESIKIQETTCVQPVKAESDECDQKVDQSLVSCEVKTVMETNLDYLGESGDQTETQVSPVQHETNVSPQSDETPETLRTMENPQTMQPAQMDPVVIEDKVGEPVLPEEYVHGFRDEFDQAVEKVKKLESTEMETSTEMKVEVFGETVERPVLPEQYVHGFSDEFDRAVEKVRKLETTQEQPVTEQKLEEFGRVVERPALPHSYVRSFHDELDHRPEKVRKLETDELHEHVDSVTDDPGETVKLLDKSEHSAHHTKAQVKEDQPTTLSEESTRLIQEVDVTPTKGELDLSGSTMAAESHTADAAENPDNKLQSVDVKCHEHVAVSKTDTEEEYQPADITQERDITTDVDTVTQDILRHQDDKLSNVQQEAIEDGFVIISASDSKLDDKILSSPSSMSSEADEESKRSSVIFRELDVAQSVEILETIPGDKLDNLESSMVMIDSKSLTEGPADQLSSDEFDTAVVPLEDSVSLLSSSSVPSEPEDAKEERTTKEITLGLEQKSHGKKKRRPPPVTGFYGEGTTSSQTQDIASIERVHSSERRSVGTDLSVSCDKEEPHHEDPNETIQVHIESSSEKSSEEAYDMDDITAILDEDDNINDQMDEGNKSEIFAEHSVPQISVDVPQQTPDDVALPQTEQEEMRLSVRQEKSRKDSFTELYLEQEQQLRAVSLPQIEEPCVGSGSESETEIETPKRKGSEDFLDVLVDQQRVSREVTPCLDEIVLLQNKSEKSTWEDNSECVDEATPDEVMYQDQEVTDIEYQQQSSKDSLDMLAEQQPAAQLSEEHRPDMSVQHQKSKDSLDILAEQQQVSREVSLEEIARQQPDPQGETFQTESPVIADHRQESEVQQKSQDDIHAAIERQQVDREDTATCTTQEQKRLDNLEFAVPDTKKEEPQESLDDQEPVVTWNDINSGPSSSPSGSSTTSGSVSITDGYDIVMEETGMNVIPEDLEEKEPESEKSHVCPGTTNEMDTSQISVEQCLSQEHSMHSENVFANEHHLGDNTENQPEVSGENTALKQDMDMQTNTEESGVCVTVQINESDEDLHESEDTVKKDGHGDAEEDGEKSGDHETDISNTAHQETNTASSVQDDVATNTGLVKVVGEKKSKSQSDKDVKQVIHTGEIINEQESNMAASEINQYLDRELCEAPQDGEESKQVNVPGPGNQIDLQDIAVSTSVEKEEQSMVTESQQTRGFTVGGAVLDPVPWDTMQEGKADIITGQKIAAPEITGSEVGKELKKDRELLASEREIERQELVVAAAMAESVEKPRLEGGTADTENKSTVMEQLPIATRSATPVNTQICEKTEESGEVIPPDQTQLPELQHEQAGQQHDPALQQAGDLYIAPGTVRLDTAVTTFSTEHSELFLTETESSMSKISSKNLLIAAGDIGERAALHEPPGEVEVHVTSQNQPDTECDQTAAEHKVSEIHHTEQDVQSFTAVSNNQNVPPVSEVFTKTEILSTSEMVQLEADSLITDALSTETASFPQQTQVIQPDGHSALPQKDFICEEKDVSKSTDEVQPEKGLMHDSTAQAGQQILSEQHVCAETMPVESEAEVMPGQTEQSSVDASVVFASPQERQVYDILKENTLVEDQSDVTDTEVPVNQESVKDESPGNIMLDVDEPSVSETPAALQEQNIIDTEMPVMAKPKDEMPVMDKPKDEMPVMDKPKDEMPVMDKPKEKSPVSVKDESPGNILLDVHEPSVSETPVAMQEQNIIDTEMPVTDKPKDEMPVMDKPKDEMPVIEKPEDEMPVTDKPKEKSPDIEMQLQMTEDHAEKGKQSEDEQKSTYVKTGQTLETNRSEEMVEEQQRSIDSTAVTQTQTVNKGADVSFKSREQIEDTIEVEPVPTQVIQETMFEKTEEIQRDSATLVRYQDQVSSIAKPVPSPDLPNKEADDKPIPTLAQQEVQQPQPVVSTDQHPVAVVEGMHVDILPERSVPVENKPHETSERKSEPHTHNMDSISQETREIHSVCEEETEDTCHNIQTVLETDQSAVDKLERVTTGDVSAGNSEAQIMSIDNSVPSVQHKQIVTPGSSENVTVVPDICPSETEIKTQKADSVDGDQHSDSVHKPAAVDMQGMQQFSETDDWEESYNTPDYQTQLAAYEAQTLSDTAQGSELVMRETHAEITQTSKQVIDDSYAGVPDVKTHVEVEEIDDEKFRKKLTRFRQLYSMGSSGEESSSDDDESKSLEPVAEEFQKKFKEKLLRFQQGEVDPGSEGIPQPAIKPAVQEVSVKTGPSAAEIDNNQAQAQIQDQKSPEETVSFREKLSRFKTMETTPKKLSKPPPKPKHVRKPEVIPDPTEEEQESFKDRLLKFKQMSKVEKPKEKSSKKTSVKESHMHQFMGSTTVTKSVHTTPVTTAPVDLEDESETGLQHVVINPVFPPAPDPIPYLIQSWRQREMKGQHGIILTETSQVAVQQEAGRQHVIPSPTQIPRKLNIPEAQLLPSVKEILDNLNCGTKVQEVKIQRDSPLPAQGVQVNFPCLPGVQTEDYRPVVVSEQSKPVIPRHNVQASLSSSHIKTERLEEREHGATELLTREPGGEGQAEMSDSNITLKDKITRFEQGQQDRNFPPVNSQGADEGASQEQSYKQIHPLTEEGSEEVQPILSVKEKIALLQQQKERKQQQQPVAETKPSIQAKVAKFEAGEPEFRKEESTSDDEESGRIIQGTFVETVKEDNLLLYPAEQSQCPKPSPTPRPKVPPPKSPQTASKKLWKMDAFKGKQEHVGERVIVKSRDSPSGDSGKTVIETAEGGKLVAIVTRQPEKQVAQVKGTCRPVMQPGGQGGPAGMGDIPMIDEEDSTEEKAPTPIPSMQESEETKRYGLEIVTTQTETIVEREERLSPPVCKLPADHRLQAAGPDLYLDSARSERETRSSGSSWQADSIAMATGTSGVVATSTSGPDVRGAAQEVIHSVARDSRSAQLKLGDEVKQECPKQVIPGASDQHTHIKVSKSPPTKTGIREEVKSYQMEGGSGKSSTWQRGCIVMEEDFEISSTTSTSSTSSSSSRPTQSSHEEEAGARSTPADRHTGEPQREQKWGESDLRGDKTKGDGPDRDSESKQKQGLAAGQQGPDQLDKVQGLETQHLCKVEDALYASGSGEASEAEMEVVTMETEHKTKEFCPTGVGQVTREVLLKCKTEKVGTSQETDWTKQYVSQTSTDEKYQESPVELMDVKEKHDAPLQSSSAFEKSHEIPPLASPDQPAGIDGMETENYEELCKNKGWDAFTSNAHVKSISETKSTSGPSGQSMRSIKKKQQLRQSRAVHEGQIQDDMVLEALRKLKQSSEERVRPRSVAGDSLGSGFHSRLASAARYYDWNSLHFYPDLHDLDTDELVRPRRQPRGVWLANIMIDAKPQVPADLTPQEQYQRRLEEFDSSDEENIPPPDKNRMLQAPSRFLKHCNSYMDQDSHIPVDSDSDSDSANESPKIWKKSPLHLKKTKRKLDRPSSGDGRYPGAGNGSGPYGRSLRSSDSPRTRRSPRRSSAPFPEGKSSSLSAEMQENFLKFEELQQRRRALESTSEESVPNTSGQRQKGIEHQLGQRHNQKVTTYDEFDGYSYTKYTRYVDKHSPLKASRRSDHGPEEQRWREKLAQHALNRSDQSGSAIYLTGVPHKTLSISEPQSPPSPEPDINFRHGFRNVGTSNNRTDPYQESLVDQFHCQRVPSQYFQPYEGEAYNEDLGRKEGQHRKSSFEHIYDDVDLSLEISRMNNLEFEEKQKKNRLLSQHQQKSWEEEIFGHMQEQYAKGQLPDQGSAGDPSSDCGMHSEFQKRMTNIKQKEHASPTSVGPHQANLHSLPAQQSSSTSGMQYKSHLVQSPKQDSSSSSSGSKSPRSKLDAKSLMEEERRKFEEYKKDYIRQHSSHSEDEDLKETKDIGVTQNEQPLHSHPVIPQDDYEYILRRVYHTRQDAIVDSKMNDNGTKTSHQRRSSDSKDPYMPQVSNSYGVIDYPSSHQSHEQFKRLSSDELEKNNKSSVKSLWQHHENLIKGEAISEQSGIQKDHKQSQSSDGNTQLYSTSRSRNTRPDERGDSRRMRRSRSDSIERLRSNFEGGDNVKSAFDEYCPVKHVQAASPVIQDSRSTKCEDHNLLPEVPSARSPSGEHRGSQQSPINQAQIVQVHRHRASPLALRRTFHDDREPKSHVKDQEIVLPKQTASSDILKEAGVHFTSCKPPQAPKWEPQAEKWEYSQAYKAEGKNVPSVSTPSKPDKQSLMDQMQFEPHKSKQGESKEIWESPRRQRRWINRGEERSFPKDPQREPSQQWDEAKSHYVELDKIRQQKLWRSHENLFQRDRDGDQREAPIEPPPNESQVPEARFVDGKPLVRSTVHVNLSPTTSPSPQRKLRSALYISRSLEDIPSSDKSWDQLDSHFEKQPSIRGVVRIPSVRKGTSKAVSSSEKVPRPILGESYQHPMAATFEKDQMDKVFEKQPSMRGIAKLPSFRELQTRRLRKEPLLQEEKQNRIQHGASYPDQTSGGFQGIRPYPKQEEERVDLRKIKQNLFGQEGEKHPGWKKELENVWDRKNRKVSSLATEVFSGTSEAKMIKPSNTHPSSQHFDPHKDIKLIDFASYRDSLKPRKSYIEDELTDLEKTYESLHLERDDDYYEPNKYRDYMHEEDANVRRLSITNLRKLEHEQKQPKIEPPSMQYTKQWLTDSPSAERSQPLVYGRRSGSFRPVQPEPITSPESLEVAQYTSQDYKKHYRSSPSDAMSQGSDVRSTPQGQPQFPSKIADDMAYRKIYGSPATAKRISGSGVNSPASYLGCSPVATPPFATEGYKRGPLASKQDTQDKLQDDMAQHVRQYPRTPPPISSPTSADYLIPRTTPPARARMRNRPEKEADKYHDDYAYRQLRKDVPPIRPELPKGYAHYQQQMVNLRMRSKSLDGMPQEESAFLGTRSQKPLKQERSGSFSSGQDHQERRSSLSKGVAKMVHLFSSPVEKSQSAPDLTDQSVFSMNYNEKGELVSSSSKTKHGSGIKVKKQQTPRMVKQRSEMRTHYIHPRYDGAFEDESESYSSSSGVELQSCQSLHSHSSSGPEGNSLRSPPDVEVSRGNKAHQQSSEHRGTEAQHEPSSGYGSPLRSSYSTQVSGVQCGSSVDMAMDSRHVQHVSGRADPSCSENNSQGTFEPSRQYVPMSNMSSPKAQPQEVAFRLVLDRNQTQPRLQASLPGFESSCIKQNSTVSPPHLSASQASLELRQPTSQVQRKEPSKELFDVKQKPQTELQQRVQVPPLRQESDRQSHISLNKGHLVQSNLRSFNTSQLVSSPDLPSPVSQTKEVIVDLKSGEMTPPILAAESPYGSRENLAIDRKSIAKFNLGPYQEAAVCLGPGPGLRKMQDSLQAKDIPLSNTPPRLPPRSSSLQSEPDAVQPKPIITEKIICEPGVSKDVLKTESSYTSDSGEKFHIRTQDTSQSTESKTQTGMSRMESRHQIKTEIKASPNVDPRKIKELELALQNLQGNLLGSPDPGTKRTIVIEKERRSGEETKIIKEQVMMPQRVRSPGSDMDTLDALVARQRLMSPYTSEFEFSDIETVGTSASDTDRGSDTEVEDPEQQAVERIAARFYQHAQQPQTLVSSKSSETFSKESKVITSETDLKGKTVTKHKEDYEESFVQREEKDEPKSGLERRPSIKELVKSFEGKAPAFMRRSRDLDDVQIPTK